MATRDDGQAALAESCKELLSAMAVESDLEVAFRLQMEEAIAASLASNPSTSTSSPSTVVITSGKGDDSSFFLDLVDIQYKELSRFSQELRDREYMESVMQSTKNDLKCRLHDKKLAFEILHFPEQQWKETGDWLQRPFGEGTSQIMTKERFNLYFKGLVSEESEAVVAGIGIAICDANDALIFELQKPYVDEIRREVVELEALVECLNSAFFLGIEVITLFVDDYLTYLYVSERRQAGEYKVDELIKQVACLQKKFSSCDLLLVERDQMKFVYGFAREAINSQTKYQAGPSNGKAVTVNCAICLEDIDVGQMFSVDGCLHWFCISCLRQHMVVKLHHGVMPTCPQLGCKSLLSIDKCRGFLSTEMIELMNLRIKESSLPNSEKLYCPYPRCSALLSVHEVLEHTKNFGSGKYHNPGKRRCVPLVSGEKSGNHGVSGMRRCTKCNGLFCIYCKVQWHENMTCNSYRMSNPLPLTEDAVLKSLANRKMWRQCAKCNHMIELTAGCNHIYCRCGFEFCYVCGAEWKNKKATCSCPLWDEHNIEY